MYVSGNVPLRRNVIDSNFISSEVLLFWEFRCEKKRTSSVLEMSVLQLFVQFLGMSGLGNTSFGHIDTVRNVRFRNSVLGKVSSVGNNSFRGC
jgi:hypothetical protein